MEQSAGRVPCGCVVWSRDRGVPEDSVSKMVEKNVGNDHGGVFRRGTHVGFNERFIQE